MIPFGFMKNRPPVLHGLKGLWRADGAVRLSGGNVATWVDESGNGNDFVRTQAGAEALLVASTLNGRPAVRSTITGVTTQLACPNPLVGATAAEIIAVMKSRTGAGTDNHTAWAWGGYYNTAPNSYCGYFAYTDEKIYDDFGSTTRPASSAVTGNAVRSPFIFDAMVSGSTKDSYVNGTSQHIQNAVANTIGWATTAYLGSTPGTSDFSGCWEGDFYEIMVFNRVLSSTERALIYSYINGRWGVSATAP
jgi:hypothetical protein